MIAQVYDTVRDVCSTLVGRSMPRPVGYCRAVVYGRSAVVLSRSTCLVYDLDSEKWTERRRLGTGVRQFGLAVDNGRVSLALYIGPRSVRYKWRRRDRNYSCSNFLTIKVWLWGRAGEWASELLYRI